MLQSGQGRERLDDATANANSISTQVWGAQFNAEGTEVAFLYRIGKCPRYYGRYFRTYAFTVAVDGSSLWRLPLIEGAFHHFGSDGRLLVSDKARAAYNWQHRVQRSAAVCCSL